MTGKIHDCPCDVCPLIKECGQKATECKAVKNFYNSGWYREYQMRMNIKPMKMRK